MSSIIGAVVCGSLLAASGCGLLCPCEREEFVVRVDSISAPASISRTDTLRARFWGLVGPDTCYRLKRVEKERGPGILQLRFVGELVRQSDRECLYWGVFLQHEEQVPPPLDDPFKIQVLQPDGSRLEKIVRVQ